MPSTLLSQSARRAIHELALNSETFTNDFIQFAAKEQQVLLRAIGIQIAELRDIERKWKQLTKTTPATDLRVQVAESSCIKKSDEDDGETVRNKMQWVDMMKKWQWIDATEAQDERELEVTWGRNSLLADAPDAPLRLCSNCDPVLLGCDCVEESPASCRFSISPQLLLYRLCVMFGMPKPRVDWESGVCWTATLNYVPDVQNKDGQVENYSSIEFSEDLEGEATVYYDGSAEASQVALEMVNMLVRWDHVFTHDRGIGGREAWMMRNNGQ